jgi:hypothetical protein
MVQISGTHIMLFWVVTPYVLKAGTNVSEGHIASIFTHLLPEDGISKFFRNVGTFLHEYSVIFFTAVKIFPVDRTAASSKYGEIGILV